MNSKTKELIYRYNTQQASAEEIRLIEEGLEAGTIELTDLVEISQLEGKIEDLKVPSPSANVNDRFYQMLALEKKARPAFSFKQFFSWPEFAPKLAFASFTLLLGIAVGFYLQPQQSSTNQIETLSLQVSEMKEMMMLSLLEKESATDRLKAVSLTGEMDEASAKVTSALIQTLNEDENVNVRLAALEALKPYVQNSNVREELVKSIGKQSEPLVQVSLAEVMAELRVKSSVKELEKLLGSEKTPSEVKARIKQSIDILI